MCIIKDKKTDCLCHRIKPFILADDNKEFLTHYFKPLQIEELYSFLVLAYSLYDEKSTMIDEDFELLLTTYVNDNSEQEINVNDDKYKKDLTDAYKHYANTTNKDKEQLYSCLETLIKDVERLVYNNVSNSELAESFMTTMDKKGREHLHVHFKRSKGKDNTSTLVESFVATIGNSKPKAFDRKAGEYLRATPFKISKGKESADSSSSTPRP